MTTDPGAHSHRALPDRRRCRPLAGGLEQRLHPVRPRRGRERQADPSSAAQKEQRHRRRPRPNRLHQSRARPVSSRPISSSPLLRRHRAELPRPQVRRHNGLGRTSRSASVAEHIRARRFCIARRHPALQRGARLCAALYHAARDSFRQEGPGVRSSRFMHEVAPPWSSSRWAISTRNPRAARA